MTRIVVTAVSGFIITFAMPLCSEAQYFRSSNQQQSTQTQRSTRPNSSTQHQNVQQSHTIQNHSQTLNSGQSQTHTHQPVQNHATTLPLNHSSSSSVHASTIQNKGPVTTGKVTPQATQSLHQQILNRAKQNLNQTTVNSNKPAMNSGIVKPNNSAGQNHQNTNPFSAHPGSTPGKTNVLGQSDIFNRAKQGTTTKQGLNTNTTTGHAQTNSGNLHPTNMTHKTLDQAHQDIIARAKQKLGQNSGSSKLQLGNSSIRPTNANVQQSKGQQLSNYTQKLMEKQLMRGNKQQNPTGKAGSTLVGMNGTHQTNSVAKSQDLLRKNSTINARIHSLTPEQKTKFDFHKNTSVNTQLTVTPSQLKSHQVKPHPMTQQGQTGLSKTQANKLLGEKAKTDPNLKSALTKLVEKGPKALTKSDVSTINKNLPRGNSLSANQGLSSKHMYSLSTMANKNSPATPQVKSVVSNYLQNGPRGMTDNDVRSIRSAIDRDIASGNSTGNAAALSAVLSDVRNSRNNQNAINGLAAPNNNGGQQNSAILANSVGFAGGLAAGILLTGGGVLGYPGSTNDGADALASRDASLIPAAGDGSAGIYEGNPFVTVDTNAFVPPEVPTVFYPNDPSAQIDPEMAYPTVPGIAVAVTSTQPQDQAIVFPGMGSVSSIQDLGSIAYEETPYQNTRYLRLANGTSAKVTVHLRYLVPTDEGNSTWLPVAPEDENEEWANVDLEPGQTIDLEDGDWRVNAQQVCVWAASDSGQLWNKFKNVALNLVPEAEAQYQSPEPDVFNFTIH